MARRFYRRYLHDLQAGANINLPGASVVVVGTNRAQHAPNTAIGGHAFLSDIPALARESLTLALTNVTYVDGVLDADDPALPDAGGADQIDDLHIVIDTGVEATSRLMAVIDDAAGLPLTPDGVADSVQWDATGITVING